MSARSSGLRWGAWCAIAFLFAGSVPASHVRAQETPASQAPQGYVRVLKGANMHAGLGTASVVLFMMPAGTVLPVVERTGRDGVWVIVQVTPEVRKRATRMRWRNEERGYVHASTVEFIKTPSAP
jgi:hypothetical protein